MNLDRRPVSDPGGGIGGWAESKSLFYVVYQIKENDAGSNIVANTLVISDLKPEATHDQHCFQMRLQIANIQNFEK